MQAIPTYALYGELVEDLPPERLHCESIADRSRLYNWEIKPHRHEAFFQILHIRSGAGEAQFEGTRVAISSLAPSRNRPQPLMMRGSSIWWRGQMDLGFW